jgi:RNase H-like domain found in reverse transcriptase
MSLLLSPIPSTKNPHGNGKIINKKVFETIKYMISIETLLTNHVFTHPFEMHTDASHEKLGAVTLKNQQPIVISSLKLNALNPGQSSHVTTERELFVLVEALTESHNIFLGQVVKVYTEHRTLNSANINNQCAMHGCFIFK